MRKRLFIFGLDAAPPKLIFDRFIEYLPNFKKIIKKSVFGPMRSCDPPITIPAWMVMMTGSEPGELGLYGFRHRKNYSYNQIVLPNSKSIRLPKIWDLISLNNLRSFVMGIPPTYPPSPINGWLITSFLTPDDRSNFTYPLSLKYEIKRIVPEYIFDVPFRKEDRDWVLNNIFKMTDVHHKVALNMMKRKNWDLFIYMEIGLDRIQHAFWKYMDESHKRYTKHERYSDAILRYYIKLDEILGDIIKTDPKTDILIVSDHGAKKMDGAFAVNDWLIEKGYLKLRKDVKPGLRLDKADVDWRETIAWGWGGYYARIFLNIEGRESMGIISRDEISRVIEKLRRDILSIKGPNNELWRNMVYRPSELYSTLNGNPPDLMVYFDNLNWRSAGTLGYEDYYLPENDTGPDDAVHDYDGIFIWYSPRRRKQMYNELSIYDVTPTVLRFFNVDLDKKFKGEPIEEVLKIA